MIDLQTISSNMKKLLKTSYNIHHQIESFFTGTQIQFDQSGDHFFCANGSTINKVSIRDGQVKAQVTTKNEEDIVISFTVTSDDKLLIIAYHSGLITKYNLLTETVEREFKSIHTAPTSCLKTNPAGTSLATGSSDGTVKLWNLVNHYCSHNLKGVNGVISCIEFHPEHDMLFCSAGDDCVHVFDLKTSKRVAKLSNHCSTITSLRFSVDASTLISIGRDKIATVWNLTTSEDQTFGAVVRTIPIFESIESMVILDVDTIELPIEKNRIIFATIGEEGQIKLWDAKSGSKVLVQNEAPLSADRSPGTHCFQLCLRPKHKQLCAVSAERDIFVYNLPNLNLSQQLQGHIDEILSACWFAKNDYLAVACNSADLKVIEVSTSKTHHLKGHNDIVLNVKSMADNPYLLLSSSKDCTVLVWEFEIGTMEARIIFRATGHTHSIYSLAVLNSNTDQHRRIFFSGGEDTTLKKWSFDVRTSTKSSSKSEDPPQPLMANQTIKAHEDRIDDLAVSPNDQLIATGSRDKTAKIFSVNGLQILATLKGHRRGVYAVRFSPVDQVMISAADTLLRMWNLQDFTCVKTFQGHDCAVLNFTFLSSGLQVLSGGSDGNLKLWDCKTNECIKTIDAHSSNIWALASTEDDDLIVTGGQDEKLIIWKDATKQEQEDRLTQLQTKVVQEQDFMNYVSQKKWSKALKMATMMENQSKTLNVLREIALDSPELLEEILIRDLDLNGSGITTANFLIECCSIWSGSAKNSSIAQKVLNILLRNIDRKQLQKMPSLVGNLDQLKNLTEKTFNRYERLVQDAYFVDFFLKSVKIH